ncbi:ribosomal protein S18-alanine N-acetyltransferase [Georhizobium sp. MAB10]|jgi:[ribosomal protein S18]-alanine N-acetyltransferase|uniref:ribosomal protein S18-alanine N-acetyltransferase n=1 Tax=Georhizobium sp. MAB10 TaxID=3028319 RepID=UPI0038557550
MIGGFFSRTADVEVVPMEQADCDRAAELHGASFSRPWSAEEIDVLLTQTNVYGFVARQSPAGRGSFAGFILLRTAADEAEVLTIAVREKFRSQGIGWRLMLAGIRQMRQEGVASIFLEVDAANLPALALYRRLGFVQVGEREAYYKAADGRRTTALVMRLDLI